MPSDWELRWGSAAWRAEVADWVDTALVAHERTRTGDIEEAQLRLWSVTMTVPTDLGLLWFKENCPGQSAEATVVEALAGISPDRVVVPLAVERERGWLLSPDQGQTLWARGDADVEAWVHVVTDYAALQRDTLPHAGALRDAGLDTADPAEAAVYVERQLHRLGALPEGHPRRLDPDLVRRLDAGLPWLAELGGRLAHGPVPLAFEHNDLHHDNAFPPAAPGPTGRVPLRFFDFGDALWAHPFASMRVPLATAAREWQVELSHQDVTAVRRAYLDQWTDLAGIDELEELLRLASVLSRLHRYLSWDRVLEGVAPEDLGEWATTPALWLGELATDLEATG